MTCKDCAMKRNCDDVRRSNKRSPDGTEWANYCDGFIPRHIGVIGKEVRKDGYIAFQNGFDYSIVIYDEYSQEAVMHIRAYKRYSRRNLRRVIRQYELKILNRSGGAAV